MKRIPNLRDLGGLMAAGGARIQPRRLYRSGNPAMASADDLARLHAMQLDAVIDFRSEAEKSPSEAAFGRRFLWLPQPVFDAGFSMEGVMQRLKSEPPAAMEAFMMQTYRDFALHGQAAFAPFLSYLEDDRTVLYHCTAGKDRTGFATLLVLSALGVNEADITANYLASNRLNRRFNAQMLTDAARSGLDAAVVWPLLEVRQTYLDAARAVVDQQYGGMDRYLCDTLHVDVARLRRNYLERRS